MGVKRCVCTCAYKELESKVKECVQPTDLYTVDGMCIIMPWGKEQGLKQCIGLYWLRIYKQTGVEMKRVAPWDYLYKV